MSISAWSFSANLPFSCLAAVPPLRSLERPDVDPDRDRDHDVEHGCSLEKRTTQNAGEGLRGEPLMARPPLGAPLGKAPHGETQNPKSNAKIKNRKPKILGRELSFTGLRVI